MDRKESELIWYNRRALMWHKETLLWRLRWASGRNIDMSLTELEYHFVNQRLTELLVNADTYQ